MSDSQSPARANSETTMKWTDVLGGKIFAAFTRLMVAFGDQADVIVDKINADEAIAARVAALCLHNGYEPSVSQAKAREIMGRSMFGIEEAVKHFGAVLSKRQLAYMAEIPFSEETLRACKNTHILVAVVPISIVAIRTKTADVKMPAKHRMFYQQDWYDGNSVGNDAGHLEWHLVRKTPVADSTSKTWEQQQDLLDLEIEETPEAQVVVYTIIGYFLATGERLFEKAWVRCRTLAPGGDRVRVGRFGAGGLDVSTPTGTAACATTSRLRPPGSWSPEP